MIWVRFVVGLLLCVGVGVLAGILAGWIDRRIER